MVPGAKRSGKTHNRVIRKSQSGWGRGGAGRAGASEVQQPGLWRKLTEVGSVLGAGIQGIRSLEDGLANESVNTGGGQEV